MLEGTVHWYSTLGNATCGHVVWACIMLSNLEPSSYNRGIVNCSSSPSASECCYGDVIVVPSSVQVQRAPVSD